MTRYIQKFLDEDGDGTGAVPGTLDYAATPTFFHWECPALKVFRGYRMTMTIADAQPAPFKANDYGSIAGGLPVGMLIQIRDVDDSVIQHLGHTDRFPIKRMIDWRKQCFDMESDEASGTNPDFMSYRWTFGRDGERIELLAGQKIGVLFQDNLSAEDVITELLLKGMEYDAGQAPVDFRTRTP